MTLTNQFMKQISAAAGRTKAELVLKHAKIVNVFTETIEEGDIAIEGGMIVGIGNYEGETETYQKYLGKINQELAHLADEVVEVVYGIPVYHKKSKGGTYHEKSVE